MILQSNRGMTLIEVLSSVLLLAMMATALVTISKDSIVTKSEISSEDRFTMSLQTALQIIDWDISNSYSPLFFQDRLNLEEFRNVNIAEPDYYTLLREVEGQLNNSQGNNLHRGWTKDHQPIPQIGHDDQGMLRLLTTGHRRLDRQEKNSALRWVQYQLIRPNSEDEQVWRNKINNPEIKMGQQFVRFVAPSNPWDQRSSVDFSQEQKPQILLEQVDQLQWSFWDRKTKKFRPLTELTPELLPITGLKLELELRDPLDRPVNLQRIFQPLFRENDLKRLVRYQKEQQSSLQPQASPSDPLAPNPTPPNN